MSSTPHLFVALSSHGFGHLAQVAPVLNELRQHLPDLRLTLQSSLPAAVLSSRIAGALEYISEASDFGLLMTNAMDVEPAESLAAYRAFHAQWDAHLAHQETLLAGLKPDAVLADVPYLPLAAASRLGIPAVALCSLNWADVLKSYCSTAPDLVSLRGTMLDAYNSASVFLCPAPSMSMPDLVNVKAIGTIAAIGQERRTRVNTCLELSGEEILVLVGLGGITFRLPMECWPEIPGVRWLVSATCGVKRSDILYRESVTELTFIDLLCTCDALLTKSGYGSFTEAVCNGKPVMYVKRHDWPEEPGLSRWLTEYGNAVEIDRERLKSGDLWEPLQRLLAQPRKPTLFPSGIAMAVDYLKNCLERVC
jgi:hypothetical protein